MRELRYICSSYVKRGILDKKVFLLLCGVLIFLWVILHNMIFVLQEMHLQINPLVLVPTLFSSAIIYVVLFVVYVLWLSCFSYQENGQYELIRMGKTRWYARQCAYCLFTAMLMFAWMFVCLFVIYGKQCDGSNSWGEVYAIVKSRTDWKGLGVTANLRFGTMPSFEKTSPYMIAGMYWLLYTLLATTLGMLMTVLNLCFQKNIGSVVVLLLVMSNRVLSESVLANIVNNLLWDNVYPMRVANPLARFILLEWPLWQTVLYGVLYFAVCIGALWIIGQRLIKKVDFSQR